MELWHCTCRLHDGHEIAPDPATIGAAVRLVLAVGLPRGLVIFCVVDDHLHTLLASDRDAAAETMRRLQVAFARHADLPAAFEAPRFKRIADREHLWRTVPYILRQTHRLQPPTEPFWEGSAAPDLAGLRWPGRPLRERLLRHLPELREEAVFHWLGAGSDVVSGWGDQIPREQLAVLARAAAAAFAIPTVRAGGALGQLAIRAACRAVSHEVPTILLATTLGIAPRAALAGRTAQVDPDAVGAVLRQAWLRVAWERTRRILDPDALRSAAGWR